MRTGSEVFWIRVYANVAKRLLEGKLTVEKAYRIIGPER